MIRQYTFREMAISEYTADVLYLIIIIIFFSIDRGRQGRRRNKRCFEIVIYLFFH